jgi:uncharacterized protein YndB with AHSA1/START domain
MKKSFWLYAVVATCTLGWTTAGQAVVADSSDLGFTVNLQVTVPAPPDKAYQALVNSIGRWWNSEHSFSGDAKNMYIENRAGGCFCEKLQGGGSVQHMRVVFADPGKTLRLTGGLGPLQTMAVSGSMSWNFAAGEKGTLVTMNYAVGGYLPGGLGALSGPVNEVLSEQMTRYKAFVDAGQSGAKH